MNDLASVRVLMSIYFPNLSFLREQLQSLARQEGVIVRLSVRLDFVDERVAEVTQEVLREFFPDVEVHVGENLGPADSFMELVKTCEKDSDYFAFCDQDDVWSVNKLSKAIEMLKGYGKEVYAGTVSVVNSDLTSKFISLVPRSLSFRNSLVENVVTGCTLVMRKSFVELMLRYFPRRNAIVMHDAWVYQLSTFYKVLVFDENSYILYRQHGQNEVGMQGEFRDGIRKLAKFKLLKPEVCFYSQSRELLKYMDLNGGRHSNVEMYNDLDLFVKAEQSLYLRVKFILSGRYVRNGLLSKLAYLFIYMVGR